MSAAEQVTIRVARDWIVSKYFKHPHPGERGRTDDTLFRDEPPVAALIKQHTNIYTGCIDWLQVGHFVAESFGYKNVTFTNVEYDISEFDKVYKEKAEKKDDVNIIVDHSDNIRIEFIGDQRYGPYEWMNKNGSDIARYIKLRTDKYTGCINWVQVCNDILRLKGYLNCKCVGVKYFYEDGSTEKQKLAEETGEELVGGSARKRQREPGMGTQNPYVIYPTNIPKI